jgi:hypothetical protein
VLIYKPSWSHHKGGQTSMGPFKSYDAAVEYAYKVIGSDSDFRSRMEVNQTMPTYLPWAVEGERPDLAQSNTLRLHVQRIRLDN